MSIKIVEYGSKEEGVIYRVISVPPHVSVSISGGRVEVSGPLGKLIKNFSHTGVKIEIRDNEIVVSRPFRRKWDKAIVGTVAAHIKNMFLGVTRGFKYELKVVYTHFPVKIRVDEAKRRVYIENFMGEKAPRIAKIIGDVKVEVDGNTIYVMGLDIESVGQTAANIQNATKIKDRDPRKFLDGIYVSSRGGHIK